MQPPTAKHRSLEQGIHLHAALGEVAHACKSIFLGPRGNRSNQLHMQETARLLGKNAHFWLGARLAAQGIYAISG